MALKLLETNITLDLYDHDGTRPSIKSIALDDNTRYVFAKLTYKQELYDIGSDATVKLIIIRPDKVGAQIVGESKEIRIGQEDESVVPIYGAYAELDQPAIAVAGTLLGQFIITSGDQILRSQIFTDNNGQALDADTWAGQYDGYNLDELVEKVDAAVDKVDGMEAAVSELKSGLSDISTATSADVGKVLKVKTVTDGKVSAWEFSDAGGEDALGFGVANNLMINREHGYINYNYDEPCDRPADTSVTNSLRVGIKRFNEMLTINYDGGSSSYIVIRLTGEIDSRLTNGATAWKEGIVLETGKSYKVKAELMSGTIETESEAEHGWSISVYKTGKSSTVGTYERDGNLYTRTFTAEEGIQYNIALYLVQTAVLTNAVFLVTLSEADAERYYTDHETNELLDYYDAKTNNLHNLVDYGYGSDKTVLLPSGGASEGTYVGVERYRTSVKLNLAPVNYVKRVFLSGAIRRYSGTSSYKNADGYLQLKEGHRYRTTLKWLSGTATREGADYLPDISVYVSKGTSTIATAEYTSATEKRVTFTAPADLLNVLIYIATNTTLTDALYDVTLEEIVEESDLPDYYLAELTDTVNKVRNETTAPAIVFTTVADIHRYSSNADGVQTFTQMITAMRKLSEQCKLDFVLNLGDLTDGNTVQATTLERAYQCLSEFMSIGVPYFWVMGNHDTNYAVSGSPYLFSMDECYKAYFTVTKGVTFNANEQGTDYYIDYADMGVRLIVLNANNILSGHVEYSYGNTTAAWLATALDTDKTVLLAVHQSPIRDQVYNRQTTDGATAIVSALQTFVNNGGNLIMMSGHSHLDMAFIDPWLSVMQDCQRFSNTEGAIITPDSEDTHSITGFIDNIVKPARTQYTASEDAWSVNIYKPLTNDFSMIRFGAGADRYFHVTPIAPTTVTSKLSGTLTWSTSNDAVATVADGVITGVTAGKCAIIAKDEDGNYECWIVNVT